MRPQVFSVDSGMFCLFEDWVGIKWIHSGTSVPVINSLRNSWWVLKPMSTAWWNILSCRAVSWLIKVLASAISPEQLPGIEILFSRQNATSTKYEGTSFVQGVRVVMVGGIWRRGEGKTSRKRSSAETVPLGPLAIMNNWDERRIWGNVAQVRPKWRGEKSCSWHKGPPVSETPQRDWLLAWHCVWKAFCDGMTQFIFQWVDHFFKRCYLFLERGEVRKKERKRTINVRNIDQLPFRDVAHNPGMFPDRDPNQPPVSLRDNAQPTEPHQSGQVSVSLL